MVWKPRRKNWEEILKAVQTLLKNHPLMKAKRKGRRGEL